MRHILLTFSLFVYVYTFAQFNQMPVMGQMQSNIIGTAKAPRFTVPMAMELNDTCVVEPEIMQFIWTPAMPQSVTGPVTFTYNIRIVQLLPEQQPDYAIEHNPVVYKRNNLITTECIIPQKIVLNEIKADAVYVVQVRALPSSQGVRVEDNGFSPYLMFRKRSLAK